MRQCGVRRRSLVDCETLGYLLGTMKLWTLGLVVGGGVPGAWRSAWRSLLIRCLQERAQPIRFVH